MDGSSMNGNGRQADPPGGEKPQEPQAAPEQREVPVATEVVRRCAGTTAERLDDGKLELGFLVSVGGEMQLHRFIVGENGKKVILDAATGGIHLPKEV